MSDKQTVVFTDLHGSTAVFESLGNARATELVTGFNGAISREVDKHHGQVIKTLGDGLLAIFGNATMWMAVFADMGASLLVVANGLRLLRR